MAIFEFVRKMIFGFCGYLDMADLYLFIVFNSNIRDLMSPTLEQLINSIPIVPH